MLVFHWVEGPERHVVLEFRQIFWLPVIAQLFWKVSLAKDKELRKHPFHSDPYPMASMIMSVHGPNAGLEAFGALPPLVEGGLLFGIGTYCQYLETLPRAKSWPGYSCVLAPWALSSAMEPLELISHFFRFTKNWRSRSVANHFR